MSGSESAAALLLGAQTEGFGEPIVSVERAFQIVEMLADAPSGLPLSEISRKLGVNKGIGHKLLNTLHQINYVFRNDDNGRYYLSFKVSNLNLRLLSHGHLLDQCSSVLDALSRATEEIARLAIVQDNRLTWILSVPGEIRRTQGLVVSPNDRFDIAFNTHATAKAWLSTMPIDKALKIIKDKGIVRRTQYSLVSVKAIAAELKAVAECGFATTYEENELGICAIAAPIVHEDLDKGLVCVGSVSLAAPAVRITREALKGHGPLIVGAAQKLASMWPLKAEAGIGTPVAEEYVDTLRERFRLKR